MIRFLERYYSIALVLLLPAPLWVLAAFGDTAALRDAGIWTAVLLSCWLLITKRRGFQIRGTWRAPTQAEANLYRHLLLCVLLIDIASQALLFRADRPYKVEVFKNFGFHSVYHPSAFELFHVVLFLYFLYVFFLGALFFRFSNKHLDRVWLVSGTFALGGAIALFGSRLLFGGAYNSFYFAGPLMWICPPCASPHFRSYAWTPADFFVHAAILPLIVLVVSYIVPATQRSVTPK